MVSNPEEIWVVEVWWGKCKNWFHQRPFIKLYAWLLPSYVYFTAHHPGMCVVRPGIGLLPNNSVVALYEFWVGIVLTFINYWPNFFTSLMVFPTLSSNERALWLKPTVSLFLYPLSCPKLTLVPILSSIIATFLWVAIIIFIKSALGKSGFRVYGYIPTIASIGLAIFMWWLVIKLILGL